jgi:AGZA family xanthine/uracil permease-like MFS transporter
VSTQPTAAPAVAEPRGRLDRFFEITGRRSSHGTEVRGGIVTFVTMALAAIDMRRTDAAASVASPPRG